MRKYWANSKASLTFISAALVIMSQPALAAKPEVMLFKFTLQESCTSGARGTFTGDGDITQPAGLGFSHVAGTLTFDAQNGTVLETDEAVFQFPPGFDPGKPSGTPQGIYPVLTFISRCTGSFRLLDDLSFTINDQVCTPVGQNGPPTNVTTTLRGMKLKGQFAADLQSVVGWSLGLSLELGSDTAGNQFERYCGKTMQGVRVPNTSGPRPF
jgi:hypothetical protein